MRIAGLRTDAQQSQLVWKLGNAHQHHRLRHSSQWLPVQYWYVIPKYRLWVLANHSTPFLYGHLNLNDRLLILQVGLLHLLQRKAVRLRKQFDYWAVYHWRVTHISFLLQRLVEIILATVRQGCFSGINEVIPRQHNHSDHDDDCDVHGLRGCTKTRVWKEPTVLQVVELLRSGHLHLLDLLFTAVG